MFKLIYYEKIFGFYEQVGCNYFGCVKANVEITAKLDSLNNKTLDANDVTRLIKTVSASQTLIDEELVDKKQLTLTDLYKQIQ